jgi:hypothetical protein
MRIFLALGIFLLAGCADAYEGASLRGDYMRSLANNVSLFRKAIIACDSNSCDSGTYGILFAGYSQNLADFSAHYAPQDSAFLESVCFPVAKIDVRDAQFRQLVSDVRKKIPCRK